MKVILTLITTCLLSYTLSAQPIINTQYGPIMGKDTSGVMEFLGVPYAKPPIDSLRWRPPQDPVKWTSVLATQTFKPGCMQKDFVHGDTTYTVLGSEDCLYLNIWTPDTVSKTLPVMVFIHGGANQQGAADEISGGTQIYNGKNLAERGNVVVVTIEYRLGPFGFLVHPGLDLENSNHVSGNYGLMDQIKALQWIRSNITAFGGDTSKVMVFGQSAGGLDIGDLLFSPQAKGLFQWACIESGVPSAGNYKTVEDRGIQFVNQYIQTGTDSEKIAYMRKLPADSLIKYLTNGLLGGVVQTQWQPVIDNYIMSGSPIIDLSLGKFNHVPLIIGTNADEMSLASPSTVSPSMVTALMNASVPSNYVSEGLNLYPPGINNTDARNSYVQILTDKQFTSPVRRTAQLISKDQNEPVWRYFITYKQSGLLNYFGSYHGIELFYVFNNWENATLGSGKLFTSQDDSMQTNLLNYWVNFAKTGNPNGNSLSNWPQYVDSIDCYLEINATPDGSKVGVRTEKCNFWDEASGYITAIKNNSSNKFSLAFKLNQNYPNPFNPSTKIQYAISTRQFVSLKAFDILGRKVATLVNGYKKPGNYEVTFNAGNLPSGIYFYKLRAGSYVITKKMVILK